MCTDPPERCIAHHIDAWETGGETNLRNLGPDGIPAARPPTRIYPERRLVHHPRHASPVIRLPIPGAAPSGAPATAPDRKSERAPTSADSNLDSSSRISPNAPSLFRVATEFFSGITPLRDCDLPPF
ncbi:hypothetical protein BSZ39_08825 [Bowdeniella nasicola]|uniref:Uncharacterized protein n=2 Tax=Bowdeniella nasicola TaxID=208480 RepID=A0A1Q5Q1D9_9ACTO|nr:hypothetical protein BSZ39_08825 [Bowdeniella nasicola]